MSCRGLTGRALAACQKKNRVKFVGENTGQVGKTKTGRPYTLVQEETSSLKKGDTIMLPKKYPRGVGSTKSSSYLSGGDYTVQKIGKKKYGAVRESIPLGTSPLPKKNRR